MSENKETSQKILTVTVLASGRGSNFKALVEKSKLSSSIYKVKALLTDIPDCEAKKYAVTSNINAVSIPYDKSRISKKQHTSMLIQAIKNQGSDLIVLAGYMRILPREFIKEFYGKIINIHPSLLPSFKGLAAQEQALNSGVKIAGCSVHVVTEEFDEGPIIAQAAVSVLPNDTEEDLNNRILKTEHLLLPNAINEIAKGNISIQVDNSTINIILNPKISSSNTAENSLFSIKLLLN